jgi:hypothetical protein
VAEHEARSVFRDIIGLWRAGRLTRDEAISQIGDALGVNRLDVMARIEAGFAVGPHPGPRSHSRHRLAALAMREGRS